MQNLIVNTFFLTITPKLQNRNDILVPVISIYLHGLYSVVYGVLALVRSLHNTMLSLLIK